MTAAFACLAALRPLDGLRRALPRPACRRPRRPAPPRPRSGSRPSPASPTPGSASWKPCSSTPRSPGRWQRRQAEPRSETGGGAGAAGLEPVRVALLASATADHLLPALRVAALRRGLAVTARAGAYGQYRRELLDPSDPAGLAGFGPEVVILALAARDFLGAVPLDAPAAAADAAVAGRGRRPPRLLGPGKGARRHGGPAVLPRPFPPVFGGLDAVVPGAPARLVARLNAAAADAAAAEGVLWLDVARAAARDGLGLWHDPVRWLQAKMEIAPGAAARLGRACRAPRRPRRGASRASAWCSTSTTPSGAASIGDDGLEGIVLGEGTAAGEAHLALQRYALALKDRGVLLAVCSKNEEAWRRRPSATIRRWRSGAPTSPPSSPTGRQGREPRRRSRGAQHRPRRPRLRRRQPGRARRRCGRRCRWWRCRNCRPTPRSTCATSPRPATSRPRPSPPTIAARAASTPPTPPARPARRHGADMDELPAGLAMTPRPGR